MRCRCRRHQSQLLRPDLRQVELSAITSSTTNPRRTHRGLESSCFSSISSNPKPPPRLRPSSRRSRRWSPSRWPQRRHPCRLPRRPNLSRSRHRSRRLSRAATTLRSTTVERDRYHLANWRRELGADTTLDRIDESMLTVTRARIAAATSAPGTDGGAVRRHGLPARPARRGGHHAALAGY